MVGRQETSGRGALRDSRRARLVPVTVMKSPSSFEVSVEVFSSGMSISNKIEHYSATNLGVYRRSSLVFELSLMTKNRKTQVLGGEYFFFSSHSSYDSDGWNEGGDGWISAKGQTISVLIGRLRTASALVLMGDIMVRCAKEP
jgi:hypothetical protein